MGIFSARFSMLCTQGRSLKGWGLREKSDKAGVSDGLGKKNREQIEKKETEK